MSEPAAPAWKRLATIAAFCTAAGAVTGCAGGPPISESMFCLGKAVELTGFAAPAGKLEDTYGRCLDYQARQNLLRAQQRPTPQ